MKSGYLVTAQDGHAAEILDRLQTLYNGLFLCENKGSSSKICIEDGRQHLWDESNGHRHAEKRRLTPVPRDLTADSQDLSMLAAFPKDIATVPTMGTNTSMKAVIINVTCRMPRWKEFRGRLLLSCFMIDAINVSGFALATSPWPDRYVLTVTGPQDKSDTASGDDAGAHEQDVA
jgi:hypothetical protein